MSAGFKSSGEACQKGKKARGKTLGPIRTDPLRRLEHHEEFSQHTTPDPDPRRAAAMKPLEFFVPAVVAATTSTIRIFDNVDPLIINLAAMPFAMLVQALRLSGTNSRTAGKNFLPGDVQQIILSGFVSFAALAFLHWQFPGLSAEVGLAVAVFTGWLGVEVFRVMQKIAVDQAGKFTGMTSKPNQKDGEQ